MRSIYVVAVLMALAGPAAAQNGASWSTSPGSVTTLQFAGGSGAAPDPVQRLPIEMATTFKSWCLDSGGDPVAVADRHPDFTAAPLSVSGGKNKPEVKLGIWRGPGAVVAHTDGFFAVRGAQCNVSFFLPGVPPQAELQDALTALFGADPANKSESVKKNGKPNKNYAPAWDVTDGNGQQRRVWLATLRGNQFMPGDRVLIVAGLTSGAEGR